MLKLYLKHQYRDAIFHSLRARNIAFEIIKANHRKYDPGYDWNDIEDGYMPYTPHDNDLDLKISLKSKKDNTYINIKLDLDL
jgi:hypothetical protein